VKVALSGASLTMEQGEKGCC